MIWNEILFESMLVINGFCQSHNTFSHNRLLVFAEDNIMKTRECSQVVSIGGMYSDLEPRTGALVSGKNSDPGSSTTSPLSLTQMG